MMLTRLVVQNVRNLQHVEIEPGGLINIIYGPNGSGKTSLLEAIHLLGSGNSFRTRNVRRVINWNSRSLMVYGEFTEGALQQKIGIEKNARTTHIQAAGKTLNKASDLTHLFPMLVISPESHQLMELGPPIRRRFLDRGVFHVEPNFLQLWKDFYRALKQRNSLLRQGSVKKELAFWDKNFASTAEQISRARETYVDELSSMFLQLSDQVVSLSGVGIRFLSGWNKDHTLLENLQEDFHKDLESGYTHSGPHKADLALQINGVDAKDYLSRGQQKIVVYLLKLAMALVFKQRTHRSYILLIDDLSAELDQGFRKRLFEIISKCGFQIFLTTTDSRLIQQEQLISTKMFHVEQGEIQISS